MGKGNAMDALLFPRVEDSLTGEADKTKVMKGEEMMKAQLIEELQKIRT